MGILFWRRWVCRALNPQYLALACGKCGAPKKPVR